MSCPNNPPAGVYLASAVNLSTGSVLFADPTLPWMPENFPNLPSSLVTLTAEGRLQDANISSIVLTNQIVYEPFDPPELYSELTKPLHIHQSGRVCYSDLKVGLVSSYSGAFSADISGFSPSSIGGADIQDVKSTNPDTFTNAIGKLDAWITNAFLVQPPAVSQSAIENSAFFGGVQWINFNTYSILDKFIPYVTSIIFVVGNPQDPVNNKYCSFEFFDTKYFPFQQYRDGLSPYFSPLVRLRIFNESFCVPEADVFYSKKGMLTKCIRIIDSSGYEFPNTGKVFALQNTDGESTYTTMNILLENIEYDTDIPVSIVYVNNTMLQTNVFSTIVRINSYGAPSAPTSVLPLTSTATSLTLQVERPIYSDVNGQITIPYFSSYMTNYTLSSLNTTVGGQGYRYGATSPNDISAFLPTYGKTYSTLGLYVSSIQSTTTVGIPAASIIPGIVWSTSVAAVNSAYIIGPTATGPKIASDFPPVLGPNISSVQITTLPAKEIQYAVTSTLHVINYNNGWNVGNFVSNDVVFLSTVSPIQFTLKRTVQFNDRSYPGDRQNITTNSKYTVESGAISQISLVMSTFNNDFILNTDLYATQDTNSLHTRISDSYSQAYFTKYYYNAMISEYQSVSTISLTPKTMSFSIQNANSISPQTYSTQTYSFQTEFIDNDAIVDSIVFNNIITSTTQISGIYTPTTSSLIYFDIRGSNVVYNYASSCFATAQLVMTDTAIGNLSNYANHVYMFNEVSHSEITTLPFPMNTQLSISSCTLSIYDNVYTIPYNPSYNPEPIYAQIQLQSAAPQTSRAITKKLLSQQLFIDTVSLSTVSSFSNTLGTNGLRVVSLLPRDDLPGVVENDILDFVDPMGQVGEGLNTNTYNFFNVDDSFNYNISTCYIYTHTSTISSIWSDNYSRELLYTNGYFIHAGGYKFNLYNGIPLGQPSASYPDFTYDLVFDANKGYRYASFTYESPVFTDPSPLQFAYIRLVSPNVVGHIVDDPAQNKLFPSIPVPFYYVSSMNTRMHMKVFGVQNAGINTVFETAWLNCFKAANITTFDDSNFDEASCLSTSISGNDIIYKVQFRRRYYTKIAVIIRVGIAQTCAIYGGAEVTFSAVNVQFSDT